MAGGNLRAMPAREAFRASERLFVFIVPREGILLPCRELKFAPPPKPGALAPSCPACASVAFNSLPHGYTKRTRGRVLFVHLCRGRELNPRRQPLPRRCFPNYSGVRTISSPPSVFMFLIEGGVGRYLRVYCWDSLASLYTFPATFALRGLARDCPALAGFPRIHPIFLIPHFCEGPQRFRAALYH